MDRLPRWWGAIRSEGQRGVGLGHRHWRAVPWEAAQQGPRLSEEETVIDHCNANSTNSSEKALFRLDSANGTE